MKKVCSKCKVEKELTEFNKDKRKKDGYYSSCKKCRKIYLEANKEKRAKARKAYYEAHKELENSRSNAYKKEHKERLKEYRRTIRGKEVSKRAAHRRRAKIRVVQVLGTYTYEDLKECRDFFGDCCAYTGEPLNGGGDVEHLIPISRGGTNNINNIVLATRKANSDKRAKDDWVKWYRGQPYYKKSREKKIKEWIRIKTQINLFEL